MSQQNSIILEKNGKIVIQDTENGQSELDVNDTGSTTDLLRRLNETQIDSLLQIVGKQPELPQYFRTTLNRVAREKNVIKGNISNVNNVEVGDKKIYNYFSKFSEYEIYQNDLKKFNHNQQRQTLEPVEEVAIDDLDQVTLDNLMKQERVIKHLAQNEPQSNSLMHRLQKLDLIVANNRMVKGVCLSLCNSDKIRSLSYTAIPSRFGVYNDPDAIDLETTEQLNGNLLIQYENAIGLVVKYLQLTRNLNTDKDDYEIPRIVFRELLANAFIHSDYNNRLHAVNIKIELFPDRLVITNPGYFHEDIDPNNPESIHTSMIINPDIAKVFFLCGIVETLGKGIARVRNVLNREGFQPPKYEQIKECVRVTVFKKKIKTKRLWDEAINNYAKELTLEVPKTSPEDAVGLEEEVCEVRELLNRNKNVLITGMAGMGKSFLCSYYVCKYYDDYKHIIWISNRGGDIRKSIGSTAGLASNLHIEAANVPAEALFEEIILKLKWINDFPNLMIIDDAEASVTACLHMLPAAPQWHLLATSRQEIMGFYKKPLKPLSELAALALFKKFYQGNKLQDQDITELLQVTGYHTLMIEVLAKIAAVQRYDIATLKEAIKKNLKANVLIRLHNGIVNVSKIGSFFSTLFELNKLNARELWLLKQFTSLPAGFHTYELLEALVTAPETEYGGPLSETLEDLVQKGWVLQDKGEDRYKVQSVLVEILKQNNIISGQDVTGLTESESHRLDNEFPDAWVGEDLTNAIEIRVYWRSIGIIRAAAAVLGLIILCTLCFYYGPSGFRDRNATRALSFRNRQDNTNRTVIIPRSKEDSISLPDGSTVRVNSESRLKIQFSEDNRKVSFRGEGYFKVAPDHRPFIVVTPHATIEVLGTEFNVNTYDSGVTKVTLIKGKIQFKALNKDVIVQAGQELVYEHDRGYWLEPCMSNVATAWQRGIYYFRSENLKTIALRLERLFGTPVVIDDEDLLQKTYTGIVNKSVGLMPNIRDIQMAYEFNYYFAGDTLHITSRSIILH